MPAASSAATLLILIARHELLRHDALADAGRRRRGCASGRTWPCLGDAAGVVGLVAVVQLEQHAAWRTHGDPLDIHLAGHLEPPGAARASSCITPRSALVLATMLGRWTLTATSVPSWSVARWTWAVDAAAKRLLLDVAKSSSGGLPSSLDDDAARLLATGTARRRSAASAAPQAIPGAAPRRGSPPSGRSSRRSGRGPGACSRIRAGVDTPTSGSSSRRITRWIQARTRPTGVPPGRCRARTGRGCRRPAGSAGSR